MLGGGIYLFFTNPCKGVCKVSSEKGFSILACDIHADCTIVGKCDKFQSLPVIGGKLSPAQSTFFVMGCGAWIFLIGRCCYGGTGAVESKPKKYRVIYEEGAVIRSGFDPKKSELVGTLPHDSTVRLLRTLTSGAHLSTSDSVHTGIY